MAHAQQVEPVAQITRARRPYFTLVPSTRCWCAALGGIATSSQLSQCMVWSFAYFAQCLVRP
jgi:hypothetical protein